MAGKPMASRGAAPCKGCPDKKMACSDHCQKREFLEWKREMEIIRKNRAEYRGMGYYISESITRRKAGKK